MTDADHSPRERGVTWAQTGDPRYPFAATVDGQRWTVYLGEFPEEPLYTLLVDGQPAESFDTWPTTWDRSARP